MSPPEIIAATLELLRAVTAIVMIYLLIVALCTRKHHRRMRGYRRTADDRREIDMRMARKEPGFPGYGSN